MNSDAKLQILIEALAAAGASALAIDGHGHVAISTMDDVALEQDVAAFVAERLGRVGNGTRLVMGHAGGRLSLTVRPVAKEYGALWVVVVREVHGVAAHAGIEWLNADEVEARYEASAYGIVEGAAAVAGPVCESYARGVPLMLEGELGAGQAEIAERLHLRGEDRAVLRSLAQLRHDGQHARRAEDDIEVQMLQIVRAEDEFCTLSRCLVPGHAKLGPLAPVAHRHVAAIAQQHAHERLIAHAEADDTDALVTQIVHIIRKGHADTPFPKGNHTK